MIDKDAQAGKKFSGKPKKVSWERLWAFSGGPLSNTGWPKKNIHTDMEFAKSCGLPWVAASATQYMGYVIELLIDLFGVRWLSHGQMDAKFINEVVNAGDILTAKAEVQSVDSQKNLTRFALGVSCENQKGTVVLGGSAVGFMGEGSVPKSKPRVPTDVVPEAAGRKTFNLEPFEFTVTPELNQQYLFAEEDFHPWYIEQTPSETPIVHPGLLLNMSNATRSPSYRLNSGQAGIHARDETFFLNPARVGKKFRATWEGIGYYEKRGRTYHMNRTRIVDEDGLEIMVRLAHGTIASREISK